ncbi:MAG: hypothetical protein J6C67_06085 [Muribaculaceae bacterium]|nr:hypothetical protein [Muribaculaceae bacterium]
MKKAADLKKAMGSFGGHARTVAQGGAVDSRFFKKHFFATSFIVITCVALIAARFDNATTAATIRSLRKQIEIADSHKLQEQSRYMTLTRESAMTHLVDSLGLGLTVPETHPYLLRYNDTDNTHNR